MNKIMFVVEESQDGGYFAKAVGASIITAADNMEELKANINDAVKCHFDEEDKPKNVHFYVTREEIFKICEFLEILTMPNFSLHLNSLLSSHKRNR